MSNNDRLFAMPWSTIYPLYVKKVERKDRTEAELVDVLCWFTGHTPESLVSAPTLELSLRDFFATAPALNPNSSLITGVVCGVRVEDVEDPLLQQIRYMDKLVDELAKGKALDKIKRA